MSVAVFVGRASARRFPRDKIGVLKHALRHYDVATTLRMQMEEARLGAAIAASPRVVILSKAKDLSPLAQRYLVSKRRPSEIAAGVRSVPRVDSMDTPVARRTRDPSPPAQGDGLRAPVRTMTRANERPLVRCAFLRALSDLCGSLYAGTSNRPAIRA